MRLFSGNLGLILWALGSYGGFKAGVGPVRRLLEISLGSRDGGEVRSWTRAATEV